MIKAYYPPPKKIDEERQLRNSLKIKKRKKTNGTKKLDFKYEASLHAPRLRGINGI